MRGCPPERLEAETDQTRWPRGRAPGRPQWQTGLRWWRGGRLQAAVGPTQGRMGSKGGNRAVWALPFGLQADTGTLSSVRRPTPHSTPRTAPAVEAKAGLHVTSTTARSQLLAGVGLGGPVVVSHPLRRRARQAPARRSRCEMVEQSTSKSQSSEQPHGRRIHSVQVNLKKIHRVPCRRQAARSIPCLALELVLSRSTHPVPLASDHAKTESGWRRWLPPLLVVCMASFRRVDTVHVLLSMPSQRILLLHARRQYTRARSRWRRRDSNIWPGAPAGCCLQRRSDRTHDHTDHRRAGGAPVCERGDRSL